MKTTNFSMYVVKEAPSSTAGGNVDCSTFLENSLDTCQKTSELLYYPAFLLLGIYPEIPKPVFGKDACIPVVHCSLFTLTKIWKQPKCLKKTVQRNCGAYTQRNAQL